MPADVVRINHELRQGGLNFRSKRVETREEFLRELQQQTPDIILSDHALPTFDGFTALAVARDACPGVPFLFVTSSLGERMAIEVFKSGATDCVFKDRLSDLVPAVNRALREAQDRLKRRESDAELHGSAEFLRLIMEGTKDYAIFTLDPHGHVTSWNAGAQLIYGWRVNAVLGRHFSILYKADDVAHGKPQLALKTAAAAGRFPEEGWRIGESGNQFMAHVVITAVRNEHGKLSGFTSVTRPTTERNPAKEDLRRSEALKSAILDTALDAIISIEDHGLIQEWNLAAKRIFGYSREYALGKRVDDLIIPDTLKAIYNEGVANYLIHGVGSLLGKPVELTLKRADGSEFRAEMAISRLPTEDPPRCTALIRDITERKHAEAALRESEEHYRMLVEGVKDYAIYMMDTQGRVQTWNAGAARIHGYDTAEILGKSYGVFFTPEDNAHRMPTHLLEVARKDGRAVYEGERVRKDGRHFWVHGIITALRDEEGQLRGYSKIAHDITQQKEADEKIRRLNEELEQRVANRTAQLEMANTELEAFSYSISHDLRAPLVRISGFADMLQTEAAGKLDEPGLHHLQTITEGAQQMSRLIDALLDFSRMGREEMRNETVDVARLIAAAQRELHQEIEGRDIEWHIGDLPEVRGDPLMLQQVMINLLANALKYSRPRHPAIIEIGARREGDETIYFIRDNGVGFDMQYAAKLFGVFQRFHPQREFEGTGIGLANVRRILRRHGGRIWAESAVDKGATFFFSLPSKPKELSLAFKPKEIPHEET
jgi:PAS domain S-box-containing protein